MSLGKTLAVLLFGALLVLSGCGGGSSGKKIPADQADAMTKNIQAADQYNADGRCARAHTKVRDARFVLSQVPQSVDSDVRQGIADGLSHLDSLITSECQQPQKTQTQTTQSQTQTTTSQTQTTQSQTTPTDTTTSQTQTTLTTTTPTTTTPTQTGTSTGTTTGNGGTPPGQANGAQGGTG